MTLRRRLGNSPLHVYPLALGGDVFGWTADEADSLAVIDAYVDAGGNFIDTADIYNAWVPGHHGGESEAIIGKWLATRPHRDDLVLATKVGLHPDFPGLGAQQIRHAAEASLRRLGTDYVDVLYCHRDDPAVPLAETIGALEGLVTAGLIRYVGASNYSGARLAEWLRLAEAGQGPAPIVIQPLYNLLERSFEHDDGPVAQEAGISVVPYSALAQGYLTGKYRPGQKTDTGRGGVASRYAGPRGQRVVTALSQIADQNNVETASVAIAWLASRPGVAAPISSARRLDQLPNLLAGAQLHLTASEMLALDDASA